MRLDGARTTLLLAMRSDGLPEIVHWGACLPPGIETAPLRDRARARNLPDDDTAEASLFPTIGTGLFRTPALAAHHAVQDWSAAFTDVAVEPGDGTLRITAHDPVARLRLVLDLALPPEGDVMTLRATLTNEGEALTLDHLAAGAVRAPPGATSLRTYGGHWGHEFTEIESTLPDGSLVLENRRGRASHDRFPLLVATSPGAGEETGTAWGVHLGWSGNHRITADRLADGSLLVLAGELLMPGEVTLAPGESLSTPSLYAAWSDAGLAGLSRAFHAYARRHLLTLPGAVRPVTLNTWEGTYFDHDQARLMAQATAAAAIGIERFVLDDGWMPGRIGPRAGLGDWTPDPAKYPDGLGPLARHVTGLGMQFGLWVEPEMANPDSAALRDHPEAALAVAGRPQRLSRHQLVLDLAQPAVWARVHAALDTLLRELPIAYLKWDMNRDLITAGAPDGRPAYHAQVVATYALMDRLRSDYPDVEIESCASGGGRADWGVLARTQRVWTSDCTDALERLRIQRGASRVLPPEIMGAHISASPNHQTGRRHTLAFRAAVALFGHLGVELDPLALAAEEHAELAGWIALHKRLRPLLHAGRHVAADTLDGRALSGVVAADSARAAYLVAQQAAPMRAYPAPLLLPGLDAAAQYRITVPAPQQPVAELSATHRTLFADGLVLPGGILGQAGFSPPPLWPETATVLELVRES